MSYFIGRASLRVRLTILKIKYVKCYRLFGSMTSALFRVLNGKESFIPRNPDDRNRRTSKRLRFLYKILLDCALSQSPASHRPNPGFSWYSP
jgi:hypothetical protein